MLSKKFIALFYLFNLILPTFEDETIWSAGNCSHGVSWAKQWIGDCAYNIKQFIGVALHIFSSLLFFVAPFFQIWRNFFTKCVGLSFWFLFFNFIGDILNFTGVMHAKIINSKEVVIPENLANPIFHLFLLASSLALFMQYVYYIFFKNPNPKGKAPENTGDTSGLTQDPDAESALSVRSADHSESEDENPNNRSRSSTITRVLLLGVISMSTVMINQGITYTASNSNDRTLYEAEINDTTTFIPEPEQRVVCSPTEDLIGSIMGICYTLGKFTQILYNFRKTLEVKDLHVFMFWCQCFGNLFMFIALVCLASDLGGLSLRGTWLFYSLFCALCNGVIIFQYYYFQEGFLRNKFQRFFAKKWLKL